MNRSFVKTIGWLLVGMVIAPSLALAARGTLRGGLERQRASWSTDRASTSRTQLRDVRGLRDISFCSEGQIAVSLNVTVKGAPVAFRVVVDSVPEVQQLRRPAVFRPAGGRTQSFSYTFVVNTATFEGSNRHAIEVEWRSLTGRRVTLKHGNLNLTFDRVPCMVV